MKKFLLKSLLVAVGLLTGGSAWATDVPYTVGTVGTGDEWGSRKFSDAYEIAPGEIYHFIFTNTSYGSNNWNNWLLDCKATADTSVDDWYFTMRSDNYGWGTSYNSAMRNIDCVWGDFRTVMNGATVDMYVDYNSTDKIIRTYATITSSDGNTTWHYNFASKAINQSSVQLLLSEELAVLNITTAEKVVSVPNGTYTLYKRTTTTTDCGEQWKADDKDNIWVPSTTNDYFTYAIDGGLSLANTDAANNFKSAYSASRSLTPNEGSTVSMTAIATMGVASGRSSSYDYITIGGVSLRVLPQGGASSSCIAQVYIDGVAQGDAVSATRNVAYTFNVEINQATGVVTYSVSGGATIAEATTSTSTAISNVVFGHSRGGSESYNTNMKLTNIDITEQISAVSYANYTIHFQDNNGAKVKEDDVRNGEVGAAVGANSADKATFIADGNKYVYSSDGGGTTVTANGLADFTITYTKYGQYTYNVYAVNSSSVKLQEDPIATATVYADETATLAWSKYVKVGGTWYVSSESTFTATATEAGSKNVVYTTADIDYFFEFENLSKSGSFAATQDGDALSNNNSARFFKNSRAWTTAIAAGTYTLNIYCYGTNAKSPTLPMYYCDTDGSNQVYIGEATATTASSWQLKEKTGVVIPEGKALCFYNTANDNSNYLVDYFTLTRTGDATISATITSAEWATLYTPYALDFSEVAGLTAYTAEVIDNTVYLTEVDDVQANTGVVLQGAEGNYNIPVIASSATGKGELTGNASATTAFDAFDGFTLYVLRLINGGQTVQFNTVTEGSIAAGKAFLKIATGGGAAPSLKIAFTDAETGINEVNAPEAADNGCFNLAGQRVANPTKGLYIVNGKKVLVK